MQTETKPKALRSLINQEFLLNNFLELYTFMLGRLFPPSYSYVLIVFWRYNTLTLFPFSTGSSRKHETSRFLYFILCTLVINLDLGLG